MQGLCLGFDNTDSCVLRSQISSSGNSSQGVVLFSSKSAGTGGTGFLSTPWGFGVCSVVGSDSQSVAYFC